MISIEERFNNRIELETFLEKLQRSWEIVKTLMEKTETAMKKQFNKKRQNS